MGVATVLAATPLEPGDEVVMTDHAYPAIRNSARKGCAAAGATLVLEHVPLPLPSPENVAAIVLGAVTARTKLVIVDHVTSPTAAIFPVEAIVKECRSRGIWVLGARPPAPGLFH